MKIKKSHLAKILTGDFSSLSEKQIKKIAKAVDSLGKIDAVAGLADAITEQPVRLRAWDDGSSDETAVASDANFEDEARELWEGADYGEGDWRVTVNWEVTDILGREVESGSFDLEHETEEPECPESSEHDWTSEHEGGLDENPGVWSTGGTSMTFADHCRHCGTSRTRRTTGSQRNPGDCDTTEYGAPDPDWVAEHYPAE